MNYFNEHEHYKDTKSVIRTFTHSDEFMDNTDYLECYPDGKVTLVNKDCGRVDATEIYSLEWCLLQVEKGYWKEITSPFDNPHNPL